MNLRLRKRAFTLLEVLVSLVITALLLFSALAVLSATARGMSRSQVTSSLVGNTRQGMEQVLYQIRSGEQVLASQSLNSTTYVTSGTTVVLRAPAYDVNNAAVFIENAWDYIAVSYDAQNKRIVQTVVKNNASQRPTANKRVIAKNINSFALTYAVRDNLNYVKPTVNPPATATFTLNAVPLAKPVCYVKGVQQTVTWSSGQSVTIPAPGSSTNVQFLYNVNGASVGGVGPSAITGVTVAMTATDIDGTGTTRTRTLTGEGRLRNNRK